MAMRTAAISFDESNRIRLMEAATFRQTEELADESAAFLSKLDSFGETIHSLVDVLSTQAKRIEQEKLRAIGQRNKVDREQATRKSKQVALRHVIAQKKAELQRLRDYCNSLLKVEQSQKQLIDRLQKR